MGEDRNANRRRQGRDASRAGGSSRRSRNDYDQEESYSRSQRQQKRERFKEQNNSNKTKIIYAVAIFVAILGGYLWYSNGTTSASSGTIASSSSSSSAGTSQRRSAGTFTVVNPENGVMTFPAANFADGKAKYYTYKGNGKEIDFFIMKSSDGVIRAAIDSCDVCYSYHKGYHQEGDQMVCNNCGQRFPSNQINVITGGCNPVALTRTTQGDNVTITESDLLKDNNNLYF